MRFRLLLLSLCALCLSAPASAWAAQTGWDTPTQDQSTNWPLGCPSGNCGGGKAALNNLTGFADRTATFWLDWHKRILENPKHKACSPRRDGGTVSAVCVYPFPRWTRDFRVNGLKAAQRSGSKPEDVAYNIAAGALAGQVGVHPGYSGQGGFACDALGLPINYNSCKRKINYNAATGWLGINQIHIADPGYKGPEKGSNDRGRQMLGGVRLWRECLRASTGYSDDTAATTVASRGQKCNATPILERMPPADRAYSNVDYFYRSSAGKPVPSSQGGNRADTPVAGVLYGRCTGPWCEPVSSGGVVGAVLKNAPKNPQYFERACNNGVLGPALVWTRSEFLRQAYDMRVTRAGRRTLLSDSDLQKLVDWWPEGAAHPRGWPPLPASIANFRGNAWMKATGRPPVARSAACRYFSEWFALDWRLTGQEERGTPKASISLVGNAIPGRLYAAQLLRLDGRENLTYQAIGLSTAAASTQGGQIDPKFCTDVFQAHDGVAEPAAYELDSVKAKTLCKGSFPGQRGAAPADPAKLLATPPLSQLTGRANSDASGTLTTAIAAQPATATDPAAEPQAGDPQALWVPRALQAAIFNPRDGQTASREQAQSRYAANHVLNSGRSGARDGTELAEARMQPRKLGATNSVLDAFAGQSWVAGHPLARGWWWAGLLPLAATDAPASPNQQQLATTLTVAVQNPTALLSDQGRRRQQSVLGALSGDTPAGQQQLAAATTNANTRLGETRLFTLLGESRYASAWETREDCVSPSKGVVNCRDGLLPQLTTQRLTADRCELPGAPRVKLPGRRPVACSTSLPLADGLTVADAYRVPSLAPGKQAQLIASFHQEDDADGGPAPLALQLDLPAANRPYLSGMEIWKREDFLSRRLGSDDGGAQLGTAAPLVRSDAGQTAITLCTPAERGRRVDSFRHRQQGWTYSALGDPQKLTGWSPTNDGLDLAGTDRALLSKDFWAPAPGAAVRPDGSWLNPADSLVLRKNGATRIFDTPDRDGRRPYKDRLYLLAATPAQLSSPTFKYRAWSTRSNSWVTRVWGDQAAERGWSRYGWGRHWWFSAQDLNPASDWELWQDTPAAGCGDLPGSPPEVSVPSTPGAPAPLTGLEGGDYVLVARLSNSASATTPMPAIDRWGVNATLYDLPGRQWVNAFDAQYSSALVSVFRTRVQG